MKLLVADVRELFDHAEAYFHITPSPCRDHNGSRYVHGTSRCVIGNVVLTDSDYEVYWLKCFDGTAPGLLAGLFGVHPNTKLSRAAAQVQMLHDDTTNWISGAGFTAWEEFFNLKREYI